jgi:hypothetical protein
MTSADSLSLILRRLDEIERKLDRILEELRTHGHWLFGAPGQSSKEGLKVGGASLRLLASRRWWRRLMKSTGSAGLVHVR